MTLVVNILTLTYTRHDGTIIWKYHYDAMMYHGIPKPTFTEPIIGDYLIKVVDFLGKTVYSEEVSDTPPLIDVYGWGV